MGPPNTLPQDRLGGIVIIGTTGVVGAARAAKVAGGTPLLCVASGGGVHASSGHFPGCDSVPSTFAKGFFMASLYFALAAAEANARVLNVAATASCLPSGQWRLSH